MADMLTQLQDELDRLLHQMQASLAYIKNKAPPAAIPGQPLLSTFTELEAQAASQSQSTAQATQTTTQPSQNTATPAPGPASQEELHKDISELSRDLVIKQQQIEALIGSLPGLDTSEKAQVERMKELERELEGLEGERSEAVRERENLLRKVEEMIGRVGGQR